MAVYRYRALTPNGVIVSNRIDENNRSAVIKKLKRNNLTPISITEQIGLAKKPVKSNKRNIKDVQHLMGHKDAKTTQLHYNSVIDKELDDEGAKIIDNLFNNETLKEIPKKMEDAVDEAILEYQKRTRKFGAN